MRVGGAVVMAGCSNMAIIKTRCWPMVLPLADQLRHCLGYDLPVSVIDALGLYLQIGFSAVNEKAQRPIK